MFGINMRLQAFLQVYHGRMRLAMVRFQKVAEVFFHRLPVPGGYFDALIFSARFSLKAITLGASLVFMAWLRWKRESQ
jgi:hypothetical protein